MRAKYIFSNYNKILQIHAETIKKSTLLEVQSYDGTKEPPLNESFLLPSFTRAFPGQTRIGNSINADKWDDK